MKNIFPLLFLFSIYTSVQAQTLSSPESLEYDAIGNRWLISNNGSNEVLSRAADGTLSLFAGGFVSGPHGIEIVGNEVFVCDGNTIKVFELSTGNLLHNTTLGSGLFLNGITHDNSGNIYATAFSDQKIFRYEIATQSFNVFVSGLPYSPNGIVFDEDDNRLIFVEWTGNAQIKAVNLADSTVSLLTTTTVGSVDGITKNCQEQFYISSWSPNRITRFENDFVAPGVNMNATGLASPADIFFAQETDSLGVPNSSSMSNTVKFYHYPSCLNVSVAENEITEMPLFDVLNLGAAGIGIRLSDFHTSPTMIEIFDSSGRLVQSQQAVTPMLTFNLQNGIYMIRVSNDRRTQCTKTIVLHP